MISALLLLLAQDVPKAAEPEPEPEEVVITATFGRTTMLFDKGTDGKLRNCRIMVSSGSQARDVKACQATPVCYEKTRDEVTDCVQLTALETSTRAALLPAAAPAVTTFELSPLLRPKPLAEGQAGPTALGEEDAATERQRVKKLPPPPSAPKSEPAIRITAGNAQDQ